MSNFMFMLCVLTLAVLISAVIGSIVYFITDNIINIIKNKIDINRKYKANRKHIKIWFVSQMKCLREQPDLKDNSIAKKLKDYEEK